jgi:hypothetical protein
MTNPYLKSLGLLAGTLAILAAPALQAREKLTPEEQLAKMLKDRVAGKPVGCINLSQVRGTTIIDKTAIVYDMGNVLYVNRPAYPQSLDDDDVMVTRTWSGQLCRLDMVQMHSRAGMGLWWRGTVGLEDFVPYTKPKPAPAPETAKG